MPRAKKEKFYKIVCKANNYTYGAFPHTKDGKILAADYVKSKESESLKLKIEVNPRPVSRKSRRK